MKKALILSISILILTGCGKPRVAVDEIEIKDSVYYYKGELFTGIVYTMYTENVIALSRLAGIDANDQQISAEYEFKNGKEDGPVLSYHLTGQLEVEAFSKNGEKDGTYKKYNKNGVLLEEGSYKQGMKDGTFKTFYEFSNTAGQHVETVETWKDGQSTGATYYDMRGNVITYALLQENKKNL